MKLFRSYGLEPFASNNSVGISVPPDVQLFLMARQGQELTGDVGTLFGLQYESCRGFGRKEFEYSILLEKATLNILLKGLAALLEALNTVEPSVRSNDPQLVEISLNNYDEGHFGMSAEIHRDLYEWAKIHLQDYTPLPAEISSQSAKIWDAISPSEFGQAEARQFECVARGSTISLGRAGGNFCATVLPPQGIGAVVDVHNSHDCPPLVPLLIYQLALIEQAYRDHNKDEDDTDEPGEV